VSQLFEKGMYGYNLGTPALKPYKQAIKSYQNDTILKEKATKNSSSDEMRFRNLVFMRVTNKFI